MIYKHVNIDIKTTDLDRVNEDGIRYYLTPEGNKYPSITTVLSEYNRKAIFEWRQRVGEEEANRKSKKASGRGTRIHKLCEDHLKNKPLLFKNPLDVELFRSLEPVLQRINNIHAQEIPMYSNHLRVAGTVDCIAEFDNKLSVIDFKTADKTKNKDYIANYFMQAAAYAIMFEEMYGIPVAQIVIAIAVEEDKPQIFIEHRDNYVKELLRFRDLYEKKHGLSIASVI